MALTTKPLFPLGPWQPPIADFDKWKARGCNTMMYCPMGTDPAAWSAATLDKGLWQVRVPLNDPTVDVAKYKAEMAANPNMFGVLFGDEPDMNKVSQTWLLARYNAAKAAVPTVSVAVNFSGGLLIGLQPGVSPAIYKSYAQTADLIGNDIYPVTGWGRPDSLKWVSDCLDAGKTAAGDKARYCFIETSNQNLPWVPGDRGPTAAETNAETWLAIVHGAKGIYYFCEQIGGGFQFDTTPADVAVMVTTNNIQITHLADYLTQGTYTLVDSVTGVHSATWVLPKGTLTLSVNWTPTAIEGYAPLEVRIVDSTAVPPPSAQDAIQNQRLATIEANQALIQTFMTTVAAGVNSVAKSLDSFAVTAIPRK